MRLQFSVSLSSLLAIYKSNTARMTGNNAANLFLTYNFDILYQRNTTKEKLNVCNKNNPIFPEKINCPIAFIKKINGPL
jgi:hypothetical protein